MDVTDFIRITRGDNPYQREVQGKANEPITVAALLDRSRALVGARDLAYSLEEIVERLDRNAPRVAVIGGSPDHPAASITFPHAFLLAVGHLPGEDGRQVAAGIPYERAAQDQGAFQQRCSKADAFQRSMTRQGGMSRREV
jgi:hypothetical protein